MASTEKRCYYEVLGLSRDFTADEIRSAYKRLALQRHPDKLVQAGIPEAEATAAFQELVNAYEVLSDPKERAWYDSHRNQILFSSGSGDGSSSKFVPDLFSFFSNSVYSGYSDSGRGFYKVYGDLFEKIYANELNFARKLSLALPREAPVIGNLESPYPQVTAFYNYWLGFATILDFFWADQYDVMAGPNRKSRRVMEEENKKLRKKAKREYNEIVRGLAEFVKKRDKRVIDMQIKRNEEMEKKREQEKQRKKELERQKAEMARKYEEPDWAKVEEMEELEDDEDEDMVDERRNELYCVVCRKKFKSDKQWKNHEQSKKHKEKVTELKHAFSEEDKECEATEGSEREMEDENHVDGDSTGYLSVDDSVNELQDQFEDSVHLHEDDSDEGERESSEANEVIDVDSHDSQTKQIGADLGSDDEASVLEAMLSGHKNRAKTGNRPKPSAKKVQPEVDSDELDVMEYNDMKGSRRNRGGRRRRGRRQEEEEEADSTKTGVAKKNDEAEGHGEQDNDVVEPSPHPFPESNANRRADDAAENGRKQPQQAANKKHTTKKENTPKPKIASKGRKQKEAANGSNNTCEKCGEEFESKNKLHKHLGETGHASLRS